MARQKMTPTTERAFIRVRKAPARTTTGSSDAASPPAPATDMDAMDAMWRRTAYSLLDEFDCEAADAANANGGTVLAADPPPPPPPPPSGEFDDINMETSPPPPPRDDVDVDEEEENLGHRRFKNTATNNNRSSNAPGHAHANNDNLLDTTLDSTLFGTDLSCCGEETLHVLMDAELRLHAAPPSSSKNAASHGGAGGAAFGCDSPRDGSREGGGSGDSNELLGGPPPRAIEQANNDAMNIETGGNDNENNNDDDDDLSAGAASLLRGPIMAARSMSQAMGVTGQQESGGAMSLENDGLAGGGLAGGRGLMDERGAMMPNGNGTPSKARSVFLPSARKPMPIQGAARIAKGNNESSPPLSATPSAARTAFLASARKVHPGMGSSSTVTSYGADSYSPDFHSGNGHTFHGASLTPSAVRNGFVGSAVHKAPAVARPPSAHAARRHGHVAAGEAPTHSPTIDIREGFVVAAHKPPHSRHRPPPVLGLPSTHHPSRDNSPSAVREGFLTSPQDSVSTVGLRSPAEDARLAASEEGLGSEGLRGGVGLPPRIAGGMPQPCNAMPRGGQRGVEVLVGGEVSKQEEEQLRQHMQQPVTTPSTQRRMLLSPQSGEQPLQQHQHGQRRSPLSAAKYPTETPMSHGSSSTRASSAASGRVPASSPAVNQNSSPAVGGGNNTNKSGSLESIIELGEAQMRTATAMAEAVASRSNASNVPSLPPKKPFLRKGTRKEPSALHTMHSAAVTPSAQRTATAGGTPHSANDSNAPHSAGEATPSSAQNTTTAAESLADRKARLARLEQMQEDLLRDLQRREERKEEARRERRTKKMEEQKELLEKQTQRQRPAAKTPATRAAAPNTGTRARTASAGAKPSRRESNNGITPSQARSSSVGRRRVVNGAGIVEMTPSEVRESVRAQTPSHARWNSEQTPSQARVAKASAASDQNITPSRARASSAGKDARAVDFALDGCREDAYEGVSMAVDYAEQHESQGVEVEDTAVIEEPRPKPTKHPRARSAPRPRPTPRPRSTSAAKRRTGSGANARRTPSKTPKRNARARSSSVEEVDDKAAREEWKRKEEEQMALIKNMRRRQEVALREAEGERERAKAWAAAEKESVQKWAKEQRALIKKDRHKAANAALLATKKANREMEQQEGSDEWEEREVMRADLVELRASIRKMKAEAGEEARRLKETIRRHERTIAALKSANIPGVSGVAGGGTTPATKSKTPVGASAPRRRALSDYSSKQNEQLGSQMPKDHRRKSSEAGVEPTSKRQVEVEVEERPEAAMEPEQEVDINDTLTEEPTDLWLQRHLSKLNSANNQLGAKVMDEEPSNNAGIGLRKPYNATDYGGQEDENELPTQSLSRPNHSDSVPQVITAVSPSFQLEGEGHNQQESAAAKSQIFTYKNGTTKCVDADGTTTVSFANGDRKRTYANEKEGIVVYYYAATKTTQVTHQDGMQTYHFPNKQIENHYTDGRKEITYPDGTTRMIHIDGSCDTTFADGVRVIDYADGTQNIIQA